MAANTFVREELYDKMIKFVSSALWRARDNHILHRGPRGDHSGVMVYLEIQIFSPSLALRVKGLPTA
jgi:hypothetical protein